MNKEFFKRWATLFVASSVVLGALFALTYVLVVFVTWPYGFILFIVLALLLMTGMLSYDDVN